MNGKASICFLRQFALVFTGNTWQIPLAAFKVHGGIFVIMTRMVNAISNLSKISFASKFHVKAMIGERRERKCTID